MSDPLSAIASLSVVPVIAIENAPDAVALADALLEGGLGVAENMADWLKLKSVAAVDGTWIARADDIREHRFADITRNARALVECAAEIRRDAR